MAAAPPEPFAERYTNLQFVGRGAFGAVYRADDMKLKCVRALKLLNSDLAGDKDWRERFQREATSAAGLTHPNITVVFDEGVFQDQPFIVMEFIEGDPLSRIIEQREALTDPERIDLIEQLCDGLHYAHRRGIVHRDIKPVNLVVRAEYEGSHIVRTLKILDFGIAKVHNANATLTGGQLMFTPNYVSPEQIQGYDADPRSDMFAVGAVAYELLVMRKAFAIKSKNQFELFTHLKRVIVDEPHTPMAEIRPDIDAELSSIVDRALAKNPDQRYRDLAQMRRHLERVRERLEEANPPATDDGHTTVIFYNPAVQAEVLRGREALEADDPSAAISHFERAVAAAPTEGVRAALSESLEEAKARLKVKEAEQARLARLEEERLAQLEAERQAQLEAERQAQEAKRLAQLEAERVARLEAERRAEEERVRIAAEEAKRRAEEEERARLAAEEAKRRAALEAADAARRAELEKAEAARREEIEKAEAARRAESAAAEERARTAVASAREAFVGGARAEAIAELASFDDQPRVVEALRLLQAAAAAIDSAAVVVEEAPPREREQALRALAAFGDTELVREPLQDIRSIDEARRAEEARILREQRERDEALERAAREEQRRQDEAREAIERATELFAAGQRAEAIAQLEAYDEPERVSASLHQLKNAAEVIDSVEAIIREGHAASRAAALDRLSQVRPAALVERARTSLRALSAERRAAEVRAAEDAAASKAAASARELFVNGEYESALNTLAAFNPQALVEGPRRELAAALQELQSARTTIERGDPAARRATLELVARKTPADLYAKGLAAFQQLHAERVEQERQEEAARAEAERVRLQQEQLARQAATKRIADAKRALANGRFGDAKAAAGAALETLPGDETALDILAQIKAIERAELRKSLRIVGVRVARVVAPAAAAIAIAVGAYQYWPFTSTPSPQQPQQQQQTPPSTQTPTNTPVSTPPVPQQTSETTTPPVVPTSFSIDARPWARFRIIAADASSAQPPVTGTTPTRVSLIPGTYVIELENGGLTKPLRQALEVTSTSGDRAFDMPGFNPARAVTDILGPER